MTIKVRNTVFIAGLSAVGLILLIFLIGSGVLLNLLTPGVAPSDLVSSDKPYIQLIQILFLLIYILTSGILLHASFRKTSSAEIFFFFIFLLVTSLEGLRLLILAVDLTSLPYENAVTLSRAVYFGRILGTLCLFTSGLFACGMQYQRMEAVLGLCVLISLSLATTMPLDTGTGDTVLLYGNGLGLQFTFGFMIIEFLGIGNYFYAGAINNNRSYNFMALGMALVFAGRELLFRQQFFHHHLPAASGAFVLIILGTVIFGKRTHEVYLWF